MTPKPTHHQGVTSPLAGQMFFRASLFGAFGQSKRWLGTNVDGSPRALQPINFYQAGAITGRDEIPSLIENAV